jgi:hypothetical protein
MNYYEEAKSRDADEIMETKESIIYTWYIFDIQVMREVCKVSGQESWNMGKFMRKVKGDNKQVYTRVFDAAKNSRYGRNLTYKEAYIFLELMLRLGWQSHYVYVDGIRANMKEIAADMFEHYSNFTKLVKALEQKQLVSIHQVGSEHYIWIDHKYAYKGKVRPND